MNKQEHEATTVNINNNFGCMGKKINPKVIIRIHYDGRMKKSPASYQPASLGSKSRQVIRTVKKKVEESGNVVVELG